jgi:hypothetical protein
MIFCQVTDCLAPAWRDGADEGLCVGHQQILDPMAPAELIETAGNAEMTDLSVGDEVMCWECGARPPASIALCDDVMAGELICMACVARLNASPPVHKRGGVKIRLDSEGYNY